MPSAQSLYHATDFNIAPLTPAADRNFADDVLNGLALPQKQLPAKYFYDQQGSDYFDQICQLKEYYLYQTELDLLPRVATDLASIFAADCTIIEFGAGSLVKIKPLLSAITSIRRFIPIDISGIHLEMACQQLQSDFPDLSVMPVVGDFCFPVELPTLGQQQKIGFFPGSTIGNFCPPQATRFLKNARCTLESGSCLLIGVDTKKSPQYLHRAYNDAQGITAKFNRNILTRINRELGANFTPENFEHYAFYNAGQGRVEMHLISIVEQVVEVIGNTVSFRTGESIHTENSYKYTPDEFCQLATAAGWQVERTWLAEQDLFATYLLRSRS